MDSEVPLISGAILKLFVMLPEVSQGIIVKEAFVCWSRGQEVGLAIRHIEPQDATQLQHFVAADV
jgi:hypothetical protein